MPYTTYSEAIKAKEREESEAQAAYDRWEALATGERPDHGRVQRYWDSYLALSKSIRERGWKPYQESGE